MNLEDRVRVTFQRFPWATFCVDCGVFVMALEHRAHLCVELPSQLRRVTP